LVLRLINIFSFLVTGRTWNWWIIHAINGWGCQKMAKVGASEIPGHMEKIVRGKFSIGNAIKLVKQISKGTMGCI